MPKKTRVDSSTSCVDFGQNTRFLQKIPVFPCFLLCGVCVLVDFAW